MEVVPKKVYENSSFLNFSLCALDLISMFLIFFVLFAALFLIIVVGYNDINLWHWLISCVAAILFGGPTYLYYHYQKVLIGSLVSIVTLLISQKPKSLEKSNDEYNWLLEKFLFLANNIYYIFNFICSSKNINEPKIIKITKFVYSLFTSNNNKQLLQLQGGRLSNTEEVNSIITFTKELTKYDLQEFVKQTFGLKRLNAANKFKIPTVIEIIKNWNNENNFKTQKSINAFFENLIRLNSQRRLSGKSSLPNILLLKGGDLKHCSFIAVFLIFTLLISSEYFSTSFKDFRNGLFDGVFTVKEYIVKIYESIYAEKEKKQVPDFTMTSTYYDFNSRPHVYGQETEATPYVLAPQEENKEKITNFKISELFNYSLEKFKRIFSNFTVTITNNDFIKALLTFKQIIFTYYGITSDYFSEQWQDIIKVSRVLTGPEKNQSHWSRFWDSFKVIGVQGEAADSTARLLNDRNSILNNGFIKILFSVILTILNMNVGSGKNQTSILWGAIILIWWFGKTVFIGIFQGLIWNRIIMPLVNLIKNIIESCIGTKITKEEFNIQFAKEEITTTQLTIYSPLIINKTVKLFQSNNISPHTTNSLIFVEPTDHALAFMKSPEFEKLVNSKVEELKQK